MSAITAAQFTAAGTSDIFVDQYSTFWGCPVTLISDNGQQFFSKLSTVYVRLGVNKINISECDPSTNRSVERVDHVSAQMFSMVGK